MHSSSHAAEARDGSGDLRAVRASATASAASFTMRGAARRSGSSSLIMAIMRRFRRRARIRAVGLALHLGGHFNQGRIGIAGV